MVTPEDNNPNPASGAQTSPPMPLPVASGGEVKTAAPAAAAPAPAPAPPPPKQSLQERKLFNFYRPEEGHRGRALIGIALAVLLLYGCHSLWDWLPKGPEDFWGKKLAALGDDEFAINPAIILALSMAMGFLFGTYKLVNYPRFVDFIIDTENELKKVSWASKKQVINESLVVLATVVIIGVYVFVVDLVIQGVQTKIDWKTFWNKLLP
jgi:preprotein translocase subunit SecE